MSEETLVTCSSCKHCTTKLVPRFLAGPRDYYCKLEWYGKFAIDVVSGKKVDNRQLIRCHVRRDEAYFGTNGNCGQAGREWEPVARLFNFKRK